MVIVITTKQLTISKNMTIKRMTGIYNVTTTMMATTMTTEYHVLCLTEHNRIPVDLSHILSLSDCANDNCLVLT